MKKAVIQRIEFLYSTLNNNIDKKGGFITYILTCGNPAKGSGKPKPGVAPVMPPIVNGPGGYPREYGNPGGVPSAGDTPIVSPSLPSANPTPLSVPIAAIAAAAAECGPLPCG